MPLRPTICRVPHLPQRRKICRTPGVITTPRRGGAHVDSGDGPATPETLPVTVPLRLQIRSPEPPTTQDVPVTRDSHQGGHTASLFDTSLTSCCTCNAIRGPYFFFTPTEVPHDLRQFSVKDPGSLNWRVPLVLLQSKFGPVKTLPFPHDRYQYGPVVRIGPRLSPSYLHTSGVGSKRSFTVSGTLKRVIKLYSNLCSECLRKLKRLRIPPTPSTIHRYTHGPSGHPSQIVERDREHGTTLPRQDELSKLRRPFRAPSRRPLYRTSES